MKLWLLTQTRNTGYDTYESAVVAALSEEDARRWYPSTEIPKWSPSLDDPPWYHDRNGAWPAPCDVSAALIGEAVEGTKPGPVCASFNAG